MKPPRALLALSALAAVQPPMGALAALPAQDHYHFRNVVIGGGGFVTGIVFSQAEAGLAYARTDVGGAYRLDRASGTWTPLLDWAGQKDWNLYGIESLAADPRDANRVYVAAGTYTGAGVGDGEILCSDDRGATWLRVPVPFKFGGNENGRNNGERLAVDPNDGRVLLLGTRQAGLWRSADRGRTWQRVDSFPEYDEAMPAAPAGGRFYVPQQVGINIVRFDASSGRRGSPTPVAYAFASTPNDSVFRSTDGGASWAAVPGQPHGLRPTRSALSSTGILYVSYGLEPGPNRMTDGAVWRFDTHSGEWADVTPEKPSQGVRFGYGSVAVDPRNPGTVLAGTWNHYAPLDEIFRSLDGGKTWTGILSDARWNHASAPYTSTMNRHWIADVEIDPFNPGHAMFTTGFGVWATRDLADADAGRPVLWSFDDRGIEETVPLALVSPPEGAPLLSGLGDIDGFRHDDLDVSPPQGRFGTPPYKNTAHLAFAWARPSVVVRSGNTYKNDQVTGAYSLDGGRTWKAFASEPEGTAGPYWRGEGAITISCDGKTVVWSPTGVAPHYSQDWGGTWYPCVGGTVNLAVAADPVNPQRFYAYDTESGSIVVSRDGAKSFRSTGGGLPVAKGRWGPAPGKLAVVPGEEGHFWVIAESALLQSPDGGRTLVQAPGVEAKEIGFGRAAPGRRQAAIFIAGEVGGEEGLFRSDDGARTWVRASDDRHAYGDIRVVCGDPRVYGRVYVGTGGRGIICGDRVP
ncbi:MAG TPA: hypothetical protein VGG34_12200 [Opitutaceae bacterium]|jgi:photosystem II stability/assembly factor-like uncharacterized protein